MARLTCIVCWLTEGNSAGVPVRRYSAVRGVRINGRQTSKSFGIIGICDRCIIERGRGVQHPTEVDSRQAGRRARA